jgi:hypothetical protein
MARERLDFPGSVIGEVLAGVVFHLMFVDLLDVVGATGLAIHELDGRLSADRADRGFLRVPVLDSHQLVNDCFRFVHLALGDMKIPGESTRRLSRDHAVLGCPGLRPQAKACSSTGSTWALILIGTFSAREIGHFVLAALAAFWNLASSRCGKCVDT